MRTIEEIRADMRAETDDDEFEELKLEYIDTAIRGIRLSRLEELCQAELENRCVVLPCKVGDMVYYIPQYGWKPYCGIKEGHVQHITMSRINWRIRIREYHPHNTDFTMGKTVFLTSGEAENALKGEWYE